jgi:hypothetical protein
MKRTLLAATLVLLLWGMPALAGPEPDFDGDSVADSSDNCSEVSNDLQEDTDLDDCGNLCDADYDNNGSFGFTDFGLFVPAFGTTDEEKCHIQPIVGCTVTFADFGYYLANFGALPGPSGTTAGTTACP